MRAPWHARTMRGTLCRLHPRQTHHTRNATQRLLGGSAAGDTTQQNALGEQLSYCPKDNGQVMRLRDCARARNANERQRSARHTTHETLHPGPGDNVELGGSAAGHTTQHRTTYIHTHTHTHTLLHGNKSLRRHQKRMLKYVNAPHPPTYTQLVNIYKLQSGLYCPQDMEANHARTNYLGTM